MISDDAIGYLVVVRTLQACIPNQSAAYSDLETARAGIFWLPHPYVERALIAPFRSRSLFPISPLISLPLSPFHFPRLTVGR